MPRGNNVKPILIGHKVLESGKCKLQTASGNTSCLYRQNCLAGVLWGSFKKFKGPLKIQGHLLIFFLSGVSVPNLGFSSIQLPGKFTLMEWFV